MNKRTVIILVNIVLIVVLAFIFIKPSWDSIKSLKIKIAEQKQEVFNIENLLVKVQELEQKYQEVGKDVEKLSLALPKERDLPYLITQFESLTSNNGLLLESIEFNDPSKTTTKRGEKIDEDLVGLTALFPYLSFDIELNGSYEGLRGYLESLEDNVRSMDVVSIDFSSEQQGESTESNLGIFKFNLKLVVYYES
ncbi:type 4a pilus biogenesis protein PilO [Patescibacteria group bacterium]|nr:type 4a pilus biogenesis protein PilO [Patescibacteria group bacterium]MBU1563963.1 type 4a pilus biogenesis protein PilO [Patescibacteria group bacterium]